MASPIVSNVLITAGIVATLALGCAGAARAQVPSVDIRQTCRAARASASTLTFFSPWRRKLCR